jgi:hypothetical protein
LTATAGGINEKYSGQHQLLQHRYHNSYCPVGLLLLPLYHIHSPSSIMQTAFKCHSTKRAAPGHTRSRRAFRVYATSQDPENLFKAIPVAEGIIERRMMAKLTQTDQKFAAMVAMSQDEDRKKVLFRRESRTPPTDHIELIEFFLNTQADDMEVRQGYCQGLLKSAYVTVSHSTCFQGPGSPHCCQQQ